MQKDVEITTPNFVTAATVAAQLHQILSMGEQLQMTALNAAIISARAGEQGKTFGPLTDGINTLAKNIQTLVLDIDNKSVGFSRKSIMEMNHQRQQEAFNKACNLHGEDGPNHNKISILRDKILTDRNNIQQELLGNLSEMGHLMKEISTSLRPTDYLVANCRIEASHITDFCGAFNDVAEMVASTSKQISENIKKSNSLLIQLQETV